MRTPNNSSAELIVSLETANEELSYKLSTAEKSYAEFTTSTQAQIDKNLEVISTLEPVAEWV